MFRKTSMIIILPILVFFYFGVSSQRTLADDNSDQIIIPFDFSTQRPVLELYIGTDGPFRFIFDTGSDGNTIDTDLASDLGLEVVGEDTLYTPGSERRHISQKVRVPLVNFPNTITLENILMSTLDIRKFVSVDGIISPSFFAKYLMTISYPQSEIILTNGELESTENNVLSYIPKEGIINLNITVNGHPVQAHLDSGNPGGFGIPYVLKDKLHFISKPKDAGVIHTPVASFKMWRATLQGTIRVGNVVYEDPEIHLVENSKFVNLGYQFAKDLNITIDQKNKLIKFEKVTSRPVKNENEESNSKQNEYTGWYGGLLFTHPRPIPIRDGRIRRGDSPQLRREKTGRVRRQISEWPFKNEEMKI